MDFGWGSLANLGSDLIKRRHAWQFEKRAQDRNFRFQREMAQNTVQWRVADAKAAGVHPLFALGAQLPGGSFGGGASGPVSGSSSYFRNSTQGERDLQAAQLALLSKQGDLMDAQAQYYRSQAIRNGTQASNPQPDVAFGSGGIIEGQSVPYRSVGEPTVVQVMPGSEREIPGAYDLVKVQPSPQMSARQGAGYVAAGLPPGSKEYQITPNMNVLLPAANDLGEALEPLSESIGLAWAWYRINVNHYGREFTDLAFQEMGIPQEFLKAFRLWSREDVETEREAVRRRNWYERRQPGGSDAFKYWYSPSLSR